MPRYVILRHETPAGSARPSHWDLMLECGGVLRTWALPRQPDIGQSIVAEALPDHRLEYLTYEGPVSGDRGHVTRWDQGEYDTRDEGANRLVIRMAGDQLNGGVTFVRAGRHATHWSITLGP